MKLINNIGSKNIKDVIKEHPRIGDILDKHEVVCTKCTVGTCVLQDVVLVHLLGDEVEDIYHITDCDMSRIRQLCRQLRERGIPGKERR